MTALSLPFQSDSDSEGYTRYRQKLQTKGARLYAQMASGFSKRSQHFKSKFNFLTTPKKPVEERYENLSGFSLEDWPVYNRGDSWYSGLPL